MTKQEFIKNAYIAAGLDWEAVKKCINSDGYLDIYSNYYTKEVLTIVTPHIKGWDKKGHLEFRPQSLRGIDDNNGWTRIDEKGLPTEEGNYDIVENKCLVTDVYFYPKQREWRKNSGYYLPTHWRNIDEREPLY